MILNGETDLTIEGTASTIHLGSYLYDSSRSPFFGLHPFECRFTFDRIAHVQRTRVTEDHEGASGEWYVLGRQCSAELVGRR